MSGFVALHLRRLFEHRLRTALTVAGIGAATALLVAVVSLSASLTGSIARAAALAGRADVQVAEITDSGFDERLFFPVAQTEGVAAAVPFVQTSVRLDRRQAVLLGFDERARALGGPGASPLGHLIEGAEPNLNGVFVGSAVGHHPTVVVAAQTAAATAKVLGVLGGGSLPSINQGSVAMAALPVAQRLSGRRHRLDGIYVLARPGVSTADLERRLAGVLGGRAVVSSPRLLAAQAKAAASALQTGLYTVSGLALLVGGFVVFNTVTMAALERRRELATLRALGGPRRPMLARFLGEAALLGLIGAVIGAAAGVVVARALVGHLPAQIVAAFDLRIGFILPAAAIPVALVVGVGLAVAAAVSPGRAAMRVAPVEAMRPEGVLEVGLWDTAVRWRYAGAGLAGVVAGIVMALALGRPAALVAIALFWGGGLVAAFGLAPALAAGAAWLVGRFRTSGRLAAAAVGRAPRRTYVTAAAVATALALVVAQTGTERNVRASLRAADGALARRDLVVTTHQPASLAADQLLPDRLADQVARVAGVTGLSTAQEAYATINDDRVQLRGVSADSSLPIWQLAPARARQDVVAGTGVIVTAAFARYQHAHLGQVLTLSTPTGPRRATIAAVIDTFGSERGDLVLALDRLQAWYQRPGLTRIEITLDHKAASAAVRTAVAALVAATGVGAQVQTGAEAARQAEGAGQQVSAAFNAIELVIIFGAGLAILNTLTIAVVERRRELGVLRALGTSRRLLRWAVLAEAAVVGTLGAAIGLALGIGGHYFAVLGTHQVGDVPVRYHFDAVPLVIAAAAAVALTLAGALTPAWRTGRLNVLEAIGYE